MSWRSAYLIDHPLLQSISLGSSAILQVYIEMEVVPDQDL